jgi:putative ABC transport system permease protein
MFAPAGYADTPFPAPRRGAFSVNGGAIARMKPGVTVAAVQSRLDEMGSTLRAGFPAEFPPSQGWTPRALALQEDLVGKSRQSLLVLLGAVAAVLLIACANVANLMLARASSRRREFAIRLSLGASRARVIRQLLTESVLLAAGGCAVGLLSARSILRALITLVPAGLPRASEIGLDADALAFTGLISIGTAILFGLWPAIHSSQTSAQEALRDGGRSSTGGAERTRARSVIIVAQFALALVLLVTASLLIRSFASLYRVDPGFSTDGVVTAQLWMPLPNSTKGAYTTHAQRVPMLQKTEDRVRQLPGVQAVGWTTRLPLAGGRSRTGFVIEGQPVETALVNAVEPLSATPGYFPALGISLVRGRLFDNRDTIDADPVLIVSESMAAKYFSREDPVGRRIRPGGPASTAPWMTIVGVVRDVRMGRLEQSPLPQIYRCGWQSSGLSMALAVKSSGDLTALGVSLIQTVRSVDQELPLFRVRPMSEVLDTSLADRRFAMVVLAVFAGLALALSAIGLYGVLAYLVRQRTAEIGLRIALGASPRSVVALVIRQGLMMSGAGIAIGLGAAALAARAMSSLLFSVTPFDPLVFGGISLLLAVTSVLACYVPARWASRIDPLVALQRS